LWSPDERSEKAFRVKSIVFETFVATFVAAGEDKPSPLQNYSNLKPYARTLKRLLGNISASIPRAEAAWLCVPRGGKSCFCAIQRLLDGVLF
jgi:hypothetical protein